MRIIFLLVCSIINLTVLAQQPVGGTLFIYAFKKEGQTFEKVIIRTSGLGQYRVKTDTLITRKSQLKYTTKIFEPEFCELTFFFSNKKTKSVSFWASAKHYNISFDSNLSPYLAATPKDEFTDHLWLLEREIAPYTRMLNEHLKNISYTNKSIEAVELEISHLKDSISCVISRSKDEIYKRYIADYPSKPISLYALIQYAELPYEKQRVKFNPDEIFEIFKKLSPEIKNLPSADFLKNKLDIGKQQAIGKTLEDIRLPDTSGITRNIFSYKGNYVLVDFWASWCTPCREEFPLLLKIYEKYSVHNFEIVGISLDTKEKLWREAIAKDKISKWVQLIDKREVSRKKYAIRFIPESYLLNPDGKIIAKNLRGKELEKVLKKIFSNE